MTEDFRLPEQNGQDRTGDPSGVDGHIPEIYPSEFAGPAAAPEAGEMPGGGEPFPGFLELVYGVLFEPRKTMKKVAERPPVGYAALVVTIITLLGAVMSYLIALKLFNQSLSDMPMGQSLPGLRALAPLGAVFGLFWGYLKWFGYSAVMHLAADLLGGRGSARGVFAATGLASLPSLLMIPIQFLSYWLGTGIFMFIAQLAVWVWTIVLFVIGLSQVHGLSAGRSVFVVLSPILALVVLVILVIVTLLTVAASVANSMHFPGYF